MPSNNIDQLIDMVTRHYKKINQVKKGNREVRELQQIFKGTLEEFPEFIEKRRRRAEKEAKSVTAR